MVELSDVNLLGGWGSTDGLDALEAACKKSAAVLDVVTSQYVLRWYECVSNI